MLVPAILAGFHLASRLSTSRRNWTYALTALVCAAVLVGEVYLVVANARSPREWDFLAFWTPARAAAAGLDFYDPASLRAVGAPGPHSAEFVKEILDVGFWYPPVTMLLLLPLGYLEPSTASALWGIANLCLFAAGVVALTWVMRPVSGAPGYLLTMAVLLSLRGTTSTVHLGQTNFILLLALTLFWWRRRTWQGGAWAALATAIKPIGAFFLLQPLLLRYWRVLLGAAAAGLVLAAATVARFGTAVTASYFTSNVGARLPPLVYTEPINQSILAAFIRARGGLGAGASPLFDPAYLGVALLLVAVSAWLVVRLGEAHSDHGLAPLIPCALVIYPASLAHYCVLLAIPVLHVWRYREEAAGGPPAAILLVGMVAATTWISSGHVTLLANLLMWGWLVFQGFRLTAVQELRSRAERREPTRTPSSPRSRAS
jgi:hypothetical protein